MDIVDFEIVYELNRIPFAAGAMFLLRCLFCMLAEAWRVINCLKFLAGAYQRRIRFLENELKEKDASCAVGDLGPPSGVTQLCQAPAALLPEQM